MTTMALQNTYTTFQLKGTAFTLTVLQLLSTDLTVLNAQLKEAAKQNPRFFHHTPLVLDLQKIANNDNQLDFPSLIECLRNCNLIPIAACRSTAPYDAAALAAGLAILTHTAPLETPQTNKKNQPQQAAPANPTAKIVTQPVRAGQQIYAKNSDLIVLAAVHTGAELLADGHIHVYGTLRGRALAGVNGNTTARIFCQALEADLIAIAGHYWINEDFANKELSRPLQIYLETEQLRMAIL